MYFNVCHQTLHVHNLTHYLSCIKYYRIFYIVYEFIFYMNTETHRLSWTHSIIESCNFIAGINLRVNSVKFLHLMNKQIKSR